MMALMVVMMMVMMMIVMVMVMAIELYVWFSFQYMGYRLKEITRGHNIFLPQNFILSLKNDFLLSLSVMIPL